MRASDSAAVLSRIHAAGIAVWVDGGWGVDALIGAETRSHKDLDLIVARREAQVLHALLEDLAFELVVGDPSAGLYRNDAGARIDITTVEFDEHGHARCMTKTGGEHVYKLGALTGSGEIGGVTVSCLSVAAQIQVHTGYRPREEDRHDVGLLHERFGAELPVEYR